MSASKGDEVYIQGEGGLHLGGLHPGIMGYVSVGVQGVCICRGHTPLFEIHLIIWCIVNEWVVHILL